MNANKNRIRHCARLRWPLAYKVGEWSFGQWIVDEESSLRTMLLENIWFEYVVVSVGLCG